MAAGIVQTVWRENSFDCERFRVVELVVPEGDQGIIFEPNSTGVGIRLPLLDVCGCCGCYHPRDSAGECRDDAMRFPTDNYGDKDGFGEDEWQVP